MSVAMDNRYCICSRWWQRWLLRAHPAVPRKQDSGSDLQIMEYPDSPRKLKCSPPLSASNPLVSLNENPPTFPTPSPPPLNRKARKWPTRWYWQFLVLTVRTFHQSRHVFLSKLNLIQASLVALVCAFIWFQVPKVEESIPDRYGLVSCFALLPKSNI